MRNVVLMLGLILSIAIAARAQPYSGQVVDEAGVGVPHAKVMLEVTSDSWGGPLQKAEADENGRWKFEPERYQTSIKAIKVGAYAMDFAIGAGLEMNDAPMQLLSDGSFRTVLRRGTEIRGVVVDENGAPVEGAGIAIGAIRNIPNMTPEFPTDAKGEFRFFVRPDSDVTVSVFKKGFGPSQQMFRVGSEPRQLKFTLDKGHPLTVKFVDSDGESIPGVRMRAGKWRDTMVIGSLHTADEQGVLRWETAPVDAVEFSVYAQGFQRLRNVSLTARPEEHVLTLKTNGRLRARVLDDKTSEPIARLQAIPGFDMGSQIVWQRTTHSVIEGKDGELTYLSDEDNPTRLRIEADGYLPLDTETFQAGFGEQQREYRLARTPPITGQVLSASGKPAVGVDVYLVAEGDGIDVREGRLDHRGDELLVSTRSDAEGKFTLPGRVLCTVVVLSDEGVAMVDLNRTDPLLIQDVRLQMKAWGRIEGVAKRAGQPLVNEGIHYSEMHSRFGDQPRVSFYGQASTDADGKFVFERVLPGKLSLYRLNPPDAQGLMSSTALTGAIVEPGKVVQVRIGGSGRMVTGRVKVPDELKPGSFQFGKAWMSSKVPEPSLQIPPDWTDQQRQAAIEEWTEKTEAGRAWAQLAAKRQNMNTRIQPDGTFHFDDVLPGAFSVRVNLEVENPANDDVHIAGFAEVAVGQLDFAVNDEATTPLDIGTVAMTAISPRAPLGGDAPDFTVPTVDGKAFKLSDHRGKWVVLQFWATWCAPCKEEFPAMIKLHERFKDRNDVVIVGLSADADIKTVQAFADENKVPFVMGFVGEMGKSPVVRDYCVNGIPSIWLISPEGKVFTRNSNPEGVSGTLQTQLRKK
jgi:thiol-disulfide isomerase/thioredoxin/5-hydroxyisourate hydrolase-like protein (transthyretin family)